MIGRIQLKASSPSLHQRKLCPPPPEAGSCGSSRERSWHRGRYSARLQDQHPSSCPRSPTMFSFAVAAPAGGDSGGGLGGPASRRVHLLPLWADLSARTGRRRTRTSERRRQSCRTGRGRCRSIVGRSKSRPRKRSSPVTGNEKRRLLRLGCSRGLGVSNLQLRKTQSKWSHLQLPREGAAKEPVPTVPL